MSTPHKTSRNIFEPLTQVTYVIRCRDLIASVKKTVQCDVFKESAIPTFIYYAFSLSGI